MTKVFLDTNVWLRFFLKDTDQFRPVENLISQIEEGRFLAYTSSIVFLEIVFVLEKTYGLSGKQILDYLDSIKEVRNITLLEKTDTPLAIEYFQKYGIKYADCLIASQIRKGMILVSFDKEFLKIKEINFKTPDQVEIQVHREIMESE